MATSAAGLGVLPFIYVISKRAAVRQLPVPPPGKAGSAPLRSPARSGSSARTHKDLGRNWSVTLEVREQHALVTNGVYSRVRHPMYSAFWLWALAQALLLPKLDRRAGRPDRVRDAVLFTRRDARRR